MAKKNKRNLGTVHGWGIAAKNNGAVEIVALADNRMTIRALKRTEYRGGDYKVVKIAAKLEHYVK